MSWGRAKQSSLREHVKDWRTVLEVTEYRVGERVERRWGGSDAQVKVRQSEVIETSSRDFEFWK